MIHKIRETFGNEAHALFGGPVEADETYVRGKEPTRTDQEFNRGTSRPGDNEEAAKKEMAVYERKAGTNKNNSLGTIKTMIEIDQEYLTLRRSSF